MTSKPRSVSREAVGSSAKMIGGSLARARAMATRCCSPPEQLEGAAPRPSRALAVQLELTSDADLV